MQIHNISKLIEMRPSSLNCNSKELILFQLSKRSYCPLIIELELSTVFPEQRVIKSTRNFWNQFCQRQARITLLSLKHVWKLKQVELLVKLFHSVEEFRKKNFFVSVYFRNVSQNTLNNFLNYIRLCIVDQLITTH